MFVRRLPTSTPDINKNIKALEKRLSELEKIIKQIIETM
tara:strand:+ start:521 stop:637 length:117 start_codon:yes stop_codon:yes gene_type:complete